MKQSNTKTLSILNKILVSYFILIFIILSLVIGYNLSFDIISLNKSIEDDIVNLSSMLSKDPTIKNMLIKNQPDEEINIYLDTMINSMNKVDFIVIANNQDIRLYHPQKDNIGKHFSGGDEEKILNGEDNYMTETIGTNAKQRRSFASVKDENGEKLGFVMVSAYTATISDIRNQIIINGLLLFLISAIIGVILSYIISRNIKKTLLGHEPLQFVQMYLQKKEVLDALEEGVIAIDTDGTCIFSNNAATMLQESCEEVSKDKTVDHIIKNHLMSTVLSGKAEYNIEMNINDITIITNNIPINDNGKLIGAVSLFRNKTEVTKLAEELTGVKHIVEALRANTHENINKLHVILGLLQIGDVQKAMDYIMNVREDQEKNYSSIIHKIQNHTLAALLIGKINRAKELNIKLTLQNGSYLENHNLFLSTNDLVTIVGNLIENAIDAVKYQEDIREINLYIHNTKEGLTIIVDDTGVGMEKQQIPNIFTRGFSIKGENHGIGLSLISNIVERCEGTIDVESELGTGTSFTIIIRKKRNLINYEGGE